MRHRAASDVFYAPTIIVRGAGQKPWNDYSGGTGTHTEKRPHRSKSIACHPDQADSMTQAARKAGITGISYDRKTGELVSTSKSGYAKEVARRGFYDAEGADSDGRADLSSVIA